MKKLIKKSRVMIFAIMASIMFSFQLSAGNPFFGVCGHKWGPYSPGNETTVLDLAQQLGVGLYRVDLGTNDYALTDALLAAAGTRDIKLVAILSGMNANYNVSYNEGYAFALKYKGKIPYYQLSNEQDLPTLNAGLNGTSVNDYDNTKYANAKTEIQGLSDGIKAADPNAKTIVNISWIHYGFIQRLVNEGVNFDIIGIDWYWGDITNIDVNGTSLNLPAYIKSQFNKPMWMTEVDRWEGSTGGNEIAQADWISQNAPAYRNNPNISAVIVYELLNEPDAWSYEANMGLMYNTTSPKPAFNAYKNAIASSGGGSLPDVIVTSLTYNASTHLFTCVVKNQGAGAQPSDVVIGVGYSVDGTQRTWGQVNGPLAAGASITIGTDGGAYTIPNGTHTITAIADDVNRFTESNETNNQLSQSITIGSLPDVIVTSLSYNTSTHIFTCDIKNQGSVATPAGTPVGVAYSVDGVKVTWGAVTVVPLTAGASATVGSDGGAYTIPNGTHTISAYADDMNRFAESNETNNQFSGVNLPDVIVTSLTYNNGIFTCVVKNMGTVSTPTGVTIGVDYLVDDVSSTWGDVPGPLAAGASVTIGTGGGAYIIPTGTYTMAAYVDDINRFAESNETNNQFSTSFMKSAVIIASTIVMADVPKVSLYPNPATTNLTIQLPIVQVNEKAQIYNTLGRLVKEINVTNNIQQVNIEYLTNGVYFVRLTRSPNISLMFVKQ
jgi:hypothetical protein